MTQFATALSQLSDDEPGGMIEFFRLRAEPLGVAVVVCSSIEEIAATALTMTTDLVTPQSVVSQQLDSELPGAMAALAAVGLPARIVASVADARDVPLGISLAVAGIAETGTAVMAEPTLEDRCVAMTTLRCLIVIPVAKLVPRLDDVVPLLETSAAPGGVGFLSFITGPSRTADIEMSLTVGVQGPTKVSIVIFTGSMP